MHGFMHPLSGLDHQLAMILVGIFAYRLGGRALWLVPLTFVSVMAFGGFLGGIGMPIPFVEVGIALSVIVVGAIVALGVEAPLAVAMAAVGFFAIFHGHSHGSEMPLDASGTKTASASCSQLRVARGRHRRRLPGRQVEQNAREQRLSGRRRSRLARGSGTSARRYLSLPTSTRKEPDYRQRAFIVDLIEVLPKLYPLIEQSVSLPATRLAGALTVTTCLRRLHRT